MEPLQDWTAVCSQCLFWVQAVSDVHGIFYISGWQIEFSSSYRNEVTSKPVHEEFDCCPTEPDVDCCKFYSPDTGLFCDNWGPIKAGCRRGTWPCYVFDLEKKLAGKGKVKAEDLYVGDILASMPMLIAGVVVSSVGVLGILFLVLPCRKANKCCVACCKCFIELFSTNQKARIYTKVPEGMRSTDMWHLIVEYKSAIFIQRHVRKWLNRRKAKRDAEEAARRAREGRNPMKDLRACSLIEPKGERSLIPPPPPGTKSKRILYDTGNVDTFCRLVRFRVASSPKEELQRVEMAVMEDGEAEQLTSVLKIPPLDKDGRPVVTKTMRGTSFELSGVSEGWRLLKAGQLVWPHATGHQLLSAIREAARPLFLVFEGRPTDLNMALFLERVEPSKLKALSRPSPPRSARSRVSTPTKPLPPESIPGFVRTRPSPLSQRSNGSSAPPMSQRSSSGSGPISQRSGSGSGEAAQRAELKQPAAKAHLLQPLALPAPLDLPQAGLLMPPEPPPSPPRQPPPWEAPMLLALEAPPEAPAAEKPAEKRSARSTSATPQRRTQSARGAARTPSTGRTGDAGTPKGERLARIRSDSLTSPMSGRGGSRQRRRPCSGGLRRSAEHVMGRRARSLSFPRTVCQPLARPVPSARPQTAFMAPETAPRRPYSAGRSPQPPQAAPPTMGPWGMMSARHGVDLT